MTVSSKIKSDFRFLGVKMYIKRNIEKTILENSKNYPVIMVCRQSQVGKSTMLNYIKEANRKYVSFDD